MDTKINIDPETRINPDIAANMLSVSLRQYQLERDNYASQLTLVTKWLGQYRDAARELLGTAHVIASNQCRCEVCAPFCRAVAKLRELLEEKP